MEQKSFTKGMIVEGVIVQIGSEFAYVNIGAKAEASIAVSELLNPEDGKLSHVVGDTIKAKVIGFEAGAIRLSRSLKAGNIALEEAYQSGCAVKALVKATNKGGFELEVMGQRAFCPLSQIQKGKVEDPNAFVGQSFDFKIIKYAKRGHDIVLSRTALLDEENRIKREDVYAIGIPCQDSLDGGEVCDSCKNKKHVSCDEILGDETFVEYTGRYDMVEKLERMNPAERFAFWQNELSRCIRCNACRNVCPACTCEKCVFDNNNLYTTQKVAVNSFEENLFHIIRAWHVAGRCTDCGECSRVCPQNIPLHLLNRKFTKDIDELYGPYIAGSDMETKPPMLTYTTDDCEASIVHEREAAAQEAK